ncbi:hypothetical protein EMCRGX_G001398 [Ephydatia muelleri]
MQSAGIRDVLVVSLKEEKQNMNDRTTMNALRRVATVEEFYSILEQVHSKDCLHAGSKKTFAKKTAKEVTNALETWVFPIFGILHSDNGREFVNPLIEDVLATWPGAVQLSGRPRYPQLQGLVEQAHYTLANDEFQNCRVSI